MKKLYYLIVLTLILGLVLTGCSLLSNISQVPATDQSGVTYLTKAIDPPLDLVGLWHFDEDALDYSGNLNHGTPMGDASWTSGKFGNALSLDGTEDYVSVADSTSLDITTELTIEAWVHTDVNISGSTQMQIVDKGEHNYSSAYMLMIYNGNLYGRVNKNSATACIYASYPNDGDWHHVAYTFKSGEQKLYIDGSNVTSMTGTATIATNDQPLLIGRGVNRPQYCWNGAIDEVRIWSSVLDMNQLDDMLPPEVSSPNDGATYLPNQAVNADWSAADGTGTGVASVVGSISKGSALDTSTVGTHTFTVTATDYAMNEVIQEVTYYVHYLFSDFLPPVKEDRAFKVGSTIPVKFQLQDADGNYITDAVATISLQKLAGVIPAGDVFDDSSGAANDGNLFRYDPTSNQYIFNLSTKTATTGKWQIVVTLEDGATYSVNIGLK